MLNKDPIKISSIIITFVICLAGATLCFWLYTKVIQQPIVDDDKTVSEIKIKKEQLNKIEDTASPTIDQPEAGYGRGNPFLPYK